MQKTLHKINFMLKLNKSRGAKLSRRKRNVSLAFPGHHGRRLGVDPRHCRAAADLLVGRCADRKEVVACCLGSCQRESRHIFSTQRSKEGVQYSNMKTPSKHIKDFFELITAIDNEKEAKMLLEDLFTPQELSQFVERWQLIQMLNKKIPQRTIATKLNVSISTITRGSRMLQYGTGGFAHFLKKLKK